MHYNWVEIEIGVETIVSNSNEIETHAKSRSCRLFPHWIFHVNSDILMSTLTFIMD